MAALRYVSRSVAGAVRSPLLTVTDAFVGQGRPALPQQVASCSGVRRLSVFGNGAQQSSPSDGSDSKIQMHKESRAPISRRPTGLRRAPASSFLGK